MRNLHDSDSGISKKADSADEEIALRNEVGIEDRDEIGVRLGQRVINITGLGVRVVPSRQIANSSREISMSFKIWDNEFAGYMRNAGGGEAEFDRKVDADRAIHHFFPALTRQEEWLLRLDVHNLESNLCYHLRRNILRDGTSQHYPWLLPVYFDVPRTEWKCSPTTTDLR